MEHCTVSSEVLAGALPFRVIAPHGISWRRNPEFNDRLDCSVGAGEVVKVLEQWVKTDRGWLPLHDARGKPLLQPVVEDSEAARRVPAGAAGPAFTACRREKKPKEADALQPDGRRLGFCQLCRWRSSDNGFRLVQAGCLHEKPPNPFGKGFPRDRNLLMNTSVSTATVHGKD
ncbi:unnamed protein product [Symbiodinium necroappetens]|uniref:Uncharacterized protein n=1 Tax=Symbiodinium necroappetens TaxID=1628268 RepID=A0A812LZJ6_9DINO|nr:unnamed protein product [Symbiodinium necroappetens]